MGKSSAPPPPAAPNYAAAAQQQGTANVDAARQTAVLSNPNIISPYGNQTVTYNQSKKVDQAGYDQAMQNYQNQQGQTDEYGNPTSQGAAPDIANYTTAGDMQPTVTQTLTPDAQATLNAQQGVQRSLADLGQQGIRTAQNVMGSPFQYRGPNIQTGIDMSGSPRAPVNAGTTGQAAIMARLQPQIEQRSKAIAQNLANQGITPGSEAYNNAMREQQQGENDMYSQAALQGIGLDTAAQQNYYNQQLQSGQFGNTAIQQDIAKQLGLYNQPLNQISALMSGSQIQAPQFQGYTGANVQAAPIFQGVQQQGQSAMDLYGIQANQAAANNQGMMGMMGSVAGAAGMAF